MRGFLLALQFLTTIPVKIKDVDEERIAKSMIFFPLVGLILGIILMAVSKSLEFLGFKEIFINTIIVIMLIILTGGMHLDGLCDTFDALLSGKNKEDMLNIMRDPHIGVMGVISIIGMVLLKISLLSSIVPSFKLISLALICILSRWSLVFVMLLFPYARQQGKAKAFIEGVNLKIFILATLIALAFTIMIGRLAGLFIFGIIVLCSYMSAKLIAKRIGGITGDTLGAINELMEIITLFSICLLRR